MLDATTESAAPPILTDEDIAVLNADRVLLRDVHHRLPHSRSGGMIEVAADTAEHHVFMVLNRLNAHDLRGMTESQLYNRGES